jgi:Ca-activated chloride channel family protein
MFHLSPLMGPSFLKSRVKAEGKRQKAKVLRCLVLLVGSIALLAAQAPVTVTIVSPEADSYVSGPVRVVAAIEPRAAASRVSHVQFFIDGQQICDTTTPDPPTIPAAVRNQWSCQWNAGTVVTAHAVRVVATYDEPGTPQRAIRTVRTKGLGYTDNADVDAVQVSVIVTNGTTFVTGLTKAQFRIFEDGVEQQISNFSAGHAPLELVTAIDVSGSMEDSLPEVKAAAKSFVSRITGENHVSVVAFNDSVFTLARSTADVAARVRAIDRLAPWGGTALYDAILRSLEMLGRQGGRRAVVLFTDGDDQSSFASADALIKQVESNDTTIYAVAQGRALVSKPLKALLEKITSLSGGRSFFDAQPERSFDQLLEELSNQYVLSYMPKRQERDEAWRKIKVTVSGGDYEIRARQGYRLVKPQQP